MPNTKSAEKRHRTSEKARMANKAVRTRVRNVTKEARKALDTKPAEAGDSVKLAVKILDKAASKGVYKKQTVARLKSRLAKKANKAAAKS